MPSRVKLKIRIVELERWLQESREKAARAEGQRDTALDAERRLDAKYLALNENWQKFQREYEILAAHWNQFQGMVHRPGSKDFAKAEAQQDVVKAVASMVTRLLFPDGIGGRR